MKIENNSLAVKNFEEAIKNAPPALLAHLFPLEKIDKILKPLVDFAASLEPEKPEENRVSPEQLARLFGA